MRLTPEDVQRMTLDEMRKTGEYYAQWIIDRGGRGIPPDAHEVAVGLAHLLHEALERAGEVPQ